MSFYSNKRQIDWVCDALLEGKTINTMDEISAVSGWRLAAIIYQLKKRYKWNISSTRLNKIAHYKLESRKNLELPKNYVGK